MICKNCSKHIDEDSKFCQFCGEKIKIAQVKMEEVDKEFINHLEFLGYEIDKPDPESNIQRYLAKHINRSNLLFNPIKNTGISFASFYTFDEKKIAKNREGILEIINRMNNQALFCSFSLSTDYALVCAALFLGKYSKKEFADFLELYEADIQTRIKDEELLKFT